MKRGKIFIKFIVVILFVILASFFNLINFMGFVFAIEESQLSTGGPGTTLYYVRYNDGMEEVRFDPPPVDGVKVIEVRDANMQDYVRFKQDILNKNYYNQMRQDQKAGFDQVNSIKGVAIDSYSADIALVRNMGDGESEIGYKESTSLDSSENVNCINKIEIKSNNKIIYKGDDYEIEVIKTGGMYSCVDSEYDYMKEVLNKNEEVIGIFQKIGDDVLGGVNGRGEISIEKKDDIEIILKEGEIALDNGEKIIGLSQENKNLIESENFLKNGNIDDFVCGENTKIIIPEQIIAHIPLGSKDTLIYNYGIREDYLDSSPIDVFGFFISMTGNAVSVSGFEQAIRLREHNLGLNGEKIVVDLLKSFKIISGNGINLDVRNGYTKIKFHRQNTYYSRIIGKVSHNISLITNELDNENYFMVFKHGSGNRLFDKKQRISIGNMAVQHPLFPYLKIASIRKKMWCDVSEVYC